MPLITELYTKQWEDNILVGVQQLISKLREKVLVKTGVKGKACTFGYLDAETARTRSARMENTTWDDPNANRVTCYLTYWYKALMLDVEDELKMVADPKSSYVQLTLAALRRKIDELILTAARGTKYTGENGTTESALPSSQKISANSSGLTVNKLIAAQEILNEADVDENEPKYLVIAPAQLSDLLGDNKVTSADYNTLKALVPGKVEQFMGFNIIVSNLVPYSAGTRYCLAWAKSGVGLAIGKDIQARVDNIQTKHYNWATYASMYVGATRIEDKKVVEIACVET